MAQNKLNGEQRAILLEWLAADYDTALIMQWASNLGWPKLTRQAIHYYRQSRGESVKRIREDRYNKALEAGLAKKAERVARLKRHADSLEAIKWEADKNGRLWNEKAWRETLRDIADEMGDHKLVVEINTWESRAIELIRANQIDYHSLVDEFGPSLAQQLFSKAGVPIILEESKET